MDCGIRVYTDKNLDFTDLIAPIVTALAKNINFSIEESLYHSGNLTGLGFFFNVAVIMLNKCKDDILGL